MTASIIPNETDEKVIFKIPVLVHVKAAQQQHGLRHSDYQRYHQYVTRKLRRMRHSLHFQQGTKYKCVPKKVTPELVTDPRFLLIKVFEIDRNWAYAMQLKAEANSELRKRFHMISRLRNCCKRAEQLTELTNQLLPQIDPSSQLELRAYVAWIQGVLAFELHDWAKAKDLLETTQRICRGLAEAVSDPDASNNVYLSRIDDLQAQINYCIYNLDGNQDGGQLRAADLQQLGDLDLDQLLSQAKAGQASQLTSVDWLGEKVPVRSEKVKMALVILKDSETELQQTSGISSQIVVYETMLKSCSDAISVLRSELSSDSAKTAAASNDKIQAQRSQLLHTYMQFVKLSKTVDRNLLHVESALQGSDTSTSGRKSVVDGSTNKPQALARLYDTLVQNLQDLLVLPGRGQECMGWRALVQAKLVYYRTFRCYYLALTYVQNSRFTESTALLNRAKSHCQQALTLLQPSTATWTDVEASYVPGESDLVDMADRLTKLTSRIDSDLLTCRAKSVMQQASSGAGQDERAAQDSVALVNSCPLSDRLDRYADIDTIAASLVDPKVTQPFIALPPPFKPVPAKSVFFDLALNGVQFPSLDDRLESANKAATSSGGLTGMFRGWLWGGDESKQ